MQFIYNENREVITEESDGKLKRLIRGSDLWASECTYEKTWYHYASDEQGSIIFVADENEIKNRYEYDAFGNAVICEEKVENRYRYTGQQYDPVTQQYYLRARYYNPVIARFTQEDAYRGDGLNLYAYCDNNPVKYYDPSGYVCDEKYNLYRQYREQGMSAQEAQRRASLDMAGGDAAEAARRRDARIESQQARQRANQPKKPRAKKPNDAPSVKSNNNKNNRNENNNANELLPGEGNVGTYRDLTDMGSRGDDLTPHHMPSADYMKNQGVAKNDGVCMNMEQPSPGSGGRHRDTRSYGRRADLNETPREALARDIRDARRIYMEDNLYTPEIRKALQEVIEMNKTRYPDIFNK